MSNFATIQLTQYLAYDGAIIMGDDDAQICLLHRAFRESPDFHRLCTEALLTFDTEAGGTPIDTTTPATEPEKEEQP